MRRHLRPRDDQGATLVEYALAVALIAAVSIGVVSQLQDDSEAKLNSDAGRIGAQVDDAYYAGVATTTTAGSGTTTTTSGAVAVHPTAITTSASNDGNKWIGQVTVTVKNASNVGVAGVLVQGDWTDPNPTVSTSCTTTAPGGSCSMQRTDIGDSKATATFTITSMTGTGVNWTPAPGDVTTATIDCPGSAASCD
jgi:Flp pilus assembly pilin Flp